MKKTLSIATLALLGTAQAAPMIATNGYVRFFSVTKMENIEGVCQTAVSSLDLETGKIAIKSRNTTYVFPDKLMQEHFNENYMESDKFPMSSFTGTVSGFDHEALDQGKKVMAVVDGDLDVHGVVKHYHTPGYLQKAADGSVAGETLFHVKISDHSIKVPSILTATIADSVELTARFTWRPTGKAK
ncbi:MAG TPA: YceI family protein [Fibrobacteria bacterium]|nr:YceI family protein [Fibrobacteria bacterium]